MLLRHLPEGRMERLARYLDTRRKRLVHKLRGTACQLVMGMPFQIDIRPVRCLARPCGGMECNFTSFHMPFQAPALHRPVDMSSSLIASSCRLAHLTLPTHYYSKPSKSWAGTPGRVPPCSALSSFPIHDLLSVPATPGSFGVSATRTAGWRLRPWWRFT